MCVGRTSVERSLKRKSMHKSGLDAAVPISCLDYVQWTSALERYNWRDLPEWEIWPIKSMTGWYLLFHPLFLLPKFSCAIENRLLILI